MASRFDVLHFHTDVLHFPVFDGPLAKRTVTTLHNRQDGRSLDVLYAGFPDMGLVSISSAQRAAVPDANFLATVQHGSAGFTPTNLAPKRRVPGLPRSNLA